MKRGLPLLLASAGIFLYRKVKERNLEHPSFAVHFSGIMVHNDAQALELRAQTDATGNVSITVEGENYQQNWRGAADNGKLVARLPVASPGTYSFSISRLRAGNTLLSKRDVIRGTFTLQDEGHHEGNPE